MNDPVPWSPTVPEAVERIRRRDPLVRAFVYTRLDAALHEHRLRAAEPARSPLHGVPYALKDMWDTAGIPTTGGSHRYRSRVPLTSSPVYLAFQDAGAVLVGKTNLPDLALTFESASYVGGVTRNPHDLSRTAGGSSGGAAAAVADGMVAFDWASDFGGSIRLPAAFCGVLGLRLSTETWPVEGIFPVLPPSLAYMNGQGPIASSVPALRAVLRAAAPRLRRGAPPRRFAPRGVMVYPPDERTAGQWRTFLADVRPALERAFGEVRTDHGLPAPTTAMRLAPALWCSHFEDLVAADPIGLSAGLRAVASSLAFRGRFGDLRFHPHTAAVLALIALGRVTLYRDRVAACRTASAFCERVATLWDRGYVLAMPTCTAPAPRLGRSLANPFLGAFTTPGNVVDATALAVPMGRYADGLPRSMQLWAPPGSEDALLDAAERLGVVASPPPGDQRATKG